MSGDDLRHKQEKHIHLNKNSRDDCLQIEIHTYFMMSMSDYLITDVTGTCMSDCKLLPLLSLFVCVLCTAVPGYSVVVSRISSVACSEVCSVLVYLH